MAALRRRLLPATAIAFAGLAWPGATPRLAAALPCGSGFSIVHQDRVFDGVRLGVVVFRNSSLAFLTDTFAAWIPRDGGSGEALVLRHRSVPGASVTICVIPRIDAPVSARSWASHLRALVDESGGSIQILETHDSADGVGAPRALGMPTREVVLRRPSADGQGFTVERRLLAADDARAVLFRLSTPEADLAQVTADLRLFLARLEKI